MIKNDVCEVIDSAARVYRICNCVEGLHADPEMLSLVIRAGGCAATVLCGCDEDAACMLTEEASRAYSEFYERHSATMQANPMYRIKDETAAVLQNAYAVCRNYLSK